MAHSARIIISAIFISCFSFCFLLNPSVGAPSKIQWEPIKAMYLTGKTSREIAILFGISDDVIRKRASLEGWGSIRKEIKALPPANQPYQPVKDRIKPADKTVEIGSASQMPISESVDKGDAVQRALRLRDSDQFRNRVIVQADKALSTLEKQVVNNVFETDRFAEALTKVERIGARAYGYDRESDHPIVNIGILGSGSEYDPID
jgi:hypothetical protein